MDNAWQVVPEDEHSETPVLRAVLPSQNGRYDSMAGSVKTFPNRRTLKAGPFSAQSSRMPEGWSRYVHPEGKCYYYHEKYRVVTEKDVRSQTVATAIKAGCDRIQERLSSPAEAIAWPQSYEICIEPDEDGSCSYYLANFEARSIFWLEETNNHLNVPDDASEETIELKLQEEYWLHTGYFPVHRSLPVEDEEELRAILVFAGTDRMTATGSTTYLTIDECFKYLSLLETCRLPTGNSGRTFLIARLMATTCRCRSYLLYGQDGARLDREQDAVDGQSSPSPRIYHVLKYGLAPFFFSVHVEHEKSLQSVIVDNVVYPESWQGFMSARLHDWEVSAGVALLVMIGNAALSGRCNSWQSILAVASAVQSLASMALALGLIRGHRGMDKSDARQASSYLWRKKHGSLKYLPLAIQMALPQILAMWAVVVFALAVILRCAGQVFPLYQ